MNGFRIFGDYVFEFLVITFLLIVSLALVIPFVPVYVGVIAYFTHHRDDRMFKDIFRAIKDNWKILIKFTIFELIVLVVSFLNVYYFRTHTEGFNIVILVLSYVFLFIGVIFLVHAPMIIIGMNVNLRQLIYNSFLFFFGGVINSAIAVLAVGGAVILASYMPYLIPLLLYPVTLIVEILTNRNFLFFKARKMGISVEELKRKQNEDIFFEDVSQTNSKGEER